MTAFVQVVLGGAKSGKTAHALSLATDHWQQTPDARLVYVACAESHDDEMAAKILAHKQERTVQDWQTLEEPITIPSLVENFTPQDVVVLDSVGMWISNLLVREIDPLPTIDTLCQKLKNCSTHVTLIADEVGMGVVPAHRLGRQFREANGWGNQQICALAKRVDFVVAGLIQRLK